MRIGFDARMMGRSGIGRYIRSLLDEMLPLAGEHEFTLFGDVSSLKRYADFNNVKIIRWDPPIYSVQEQVNIPFNGMALDLVHFPHYNIPLLCRKKMVVTVHDLIHLLCPEGDFSIVARFYARFMIGEVMKKAAKIISVSGNTSDDLVKMFGDKYRKKIKIIHESAGKNFIRIEDEAEKRKIREKYGLSDRIILYVGNIKPHKNVNTLFKMYSKLRQWGLPHQLVIAGKWDEKIKSLQGNIDNENIKYLGQVPTEDLVRLYNVSGVLVHLSLYEGFGLTVLEAMKCGCPVVTTPVSSLPEVAGQAAFYVSPMEIGQIADTVYNVLAHEDFRGEMSIAGMERAQAFSWEKAARKTLKVYSEVK
jgi:glycosyltransferase involved in cell wall biosynthesis